MGHISFLFKKILWSFYIFFDIISLNTKVHVFHFPIKECCMPNFAALVEGAA
jgi:hypothetical protein